jgi:hypothetical protein
MEGVSFLHTPHDTSIYRATTLWAFSSEDVRANYFFFQFFDILKYVKYVFHNIGSICQNITPKLYLQVLKNCETKS